MPVTYQLFVDGKAVAPAHKSWLIAAHDAVALGHGIWMGDATVKLNKGCTIVRVITGGKHK